MAKEKYGLTCDYKYVVAIYNLESREIRFVDSVDNSTRTATWNATKPALTMSKEQAIMLQTGLLCNGFVALVIEAPDYIVEYFKNKEGN